MRNNLNLSFMQKELEIISEGKRRKGTIENQETKFDLKTLDHPSTFILNTKENLTYECNMNSMLLQRSKFFKS